MRFFTINFFCIKKLNKCISGRSSFSWFSTCQPIHNRNNYIDFEYIFQSNIISSKIISFRNRYCNALWIIKMIIVNIRAVIFVNHIFSNIYFLLIRFSTILSRIIEHTIHISKIIFSTKRNCDSLHVKIEILISSIIVNMESCFSTLYSIISHRRGFWLFIVPDINSY